MKKILLSITTALLLASCGAPVTETVVAIDSVAVAIDTPKVTIELPVPTAVGSTGTTGK